MEPRIETEEVVSDLEQDLLKLAVVERHRGTGNVGLGLVQGFGLKRGALASTVAHDSHNVVVVGTNDVDMRAAVVALVDMGGGRGWAGPCLSSAPYSRIDLGSSARRGR